MATKAKYTRIRQEDVKEDKPDTDILMRFCPTYGRYVTRALTLFFGESKNFVTIKAADKLMDRALWVAEVVRRRVAGLHQVIEIKEREIVDVYEPREEGLVRVEQKRFLTIIEIVLTKEPTAEQKKSVGYQAPIQGDQDQYLTKEKWENQEAERKTRNENRGERTEKGERGERRERREERGERREERGERREERGERREERGERREERGDGERRDNRREDRGGERRRGRN